MKKLIGIVCCIAMLCIQMNAQERLELRKGPRGREFRIGAEGEFQFISSDNKQLRSVLKSYEPSRKVYRKSKALMLTGGSLLFAGTGSFIVLGIIGNKQKSGTGLPPRGPGKLTFGRLPSSDFGYVISGLMAISLGVVSGIPLMVISKGKLYKSVRLYNSQFDGPLPVGYDKKPDIRLGITPHGVGMVMSW